MKIFFGIIVYLTSEIDLNAAEVGMPQLDPKYWGSQAFWLVLVFTFLYLAISKSFIPKIKNSLDDRDNKIKSDLDEAKNLKNTAEEKDKNYEVALENAKKEIQKLIFQNKDKLNTDIQNKRKKFDKEIDLEIFKAQNEIINLKNNSLNDIVKISEEITSKIIEDISGDKLNESSVKAAVSESTKQNMSKYL